MSTRYSYKTETVPLIIYGKEIQASEHFHVISPNTSEAICRSSLTSQKDAVAAVEVASCAFLTR
ncbi:hypothetical protein JI435_406120 [Parastagonospora nodorum SN15]|uniref:Aldehyde dehydrogenase domain-containing protein n=1 Tax=Phaeosphaeria nodorum (strain SN15 / ATCC MYA-4574 / FGSC 10173) TaxID=321614 RepID=A0A7U2EXN1_PHANO|nr:hypothetical protein JI435_406120 [Parastagonospora nodorum SN15]